MDKDDLETDLILRLQKGDELALARLYERLRRNVYALALELLRSPEDAEEVLQDTFVKLFDNARRFDPARGSARAYIYVIARNEARMRLRAARSRPVKANEIDIRRPHSLLHARKRDHATHLTLDRVLCQLKESDRELLEGSFYAGYTHDELAEQTGLPLGTVKSRIRRALLKLRTLMEKV